MPTTNGKIYLGSVLISGGGVFVGAKVTKTNQTTSFATDDDGDLQEGRDVDFFTLATNNPFGNANRFTALDGSQTYANDIIIDWSTYEGNIVLGYYRGSIATGRQWAASLTWASGLNVAGYTSWRLTNVRELQNLCNYEFGGGALTYPPISGSNRFWSSTTVTTDSSLAYNIIATTGITASNTKSDSNRTIACRNFTVTGTTLT
jgi:hypothetical protein